MLKRVLPAALVALVAPATVLADEMRFNFSGSVGLTSFADAMTDKKGGTSFMAGYRPFEAISHNDRFLARPMDSSMVANTSENPTCVGGGCLVTLSRMGARPFLRGLAAQDAILNLDLRERIRSSSGEWPSLTPEWLSRMRADREYWAAMKECRRSRCTSGQIGPPPPPIRFHH